MTNVAELDPTTLAAAVQGDVAVPDDAGWDTARAAWNLAADQRPAAVVFPARPEDVVASVAAARAAGLGIAVQGTGHGARPGKPTLEGTILLNMTRLQGVEVDPAAGTARVEAGVPWASVVAAAEPHGLAPLSGSAPDVGVVGYTLGGGLGWLGRKYGLAANSAIAFEGVTGEGEIVRASADENRDLFWALRGGGGNFMIVTALEFRLHPVRELYAGNLFWPIELAGDVLSGYGTWVETVPDELSSVGRLLHLPPIPDIPEPFRGRSLAVIESAFAGTEEEGAELLRPLRELAPTYMDTVQLMPPSGLPALHMDPPQPVPGVGDGMLVSGLAPGTIEETLAIAGPGTRSPLLSIEYRHLGGALAEAKPENGALAKLDGAFAHYAVGIAMSPEMGAAVAECLERLQSALAPWRAGQFPNFGETSTLADSFPTDVFRRLVEIKAAVDPAGVLRSHRPVHA